MSRRQPRPCPRPAENDLSAALQPQAVLRSAPRANRLLNCGLAGLVYLCCAGTTVLLARVAPAAKGPGPATGGGGEVVEVEPPTPPVITLPLVDMPRVDLPKISGEKTGQEIPPDDGTVPATPDHIDWTDRSGDHLAGTPKGEGTSPYTGGINPVVIGSDPAPRETVHRMEPVAVDFRQMSVLHQEPVLYPALASRARIEGAVELLMTVDEQGRPSQVSVVSGPPMLQAEAMRSATLWRFEPARMSGQPVPSRFKLTIVFRLRR